jgi:RimJ/RimL family protein N-acetyltransferase
VRLLFGHDADVAHWVAERIPHAAVRIPYYDRGQVFGPAAAIGVMDDLGEMLAGVVFHNYDPFVKSIEVSCASTGARWGNRETFRSILRYPFEQLNVARLSAATPKRSTSPRRFLEGLGFKREGSLRKAFGDDDAILYGLLAEDWAAGRFNRLRAASTSDCESHRHPTS